MRIVFVVVAVLLVLSGCASPPTGVVEGHFSLPGRPASEWQRAGLNFSSGSHGPGHGVTARVNADGSYSVKLEEGSYSMIGGLAGQSGGLAPEHCAATGHVVVTAHHTTRADYVCVATPVQPSPG